MDQQNYEIPASVREAAERSVSQTRDVTARFFDSARQAQTALLHGGDAATTGARQFGERTLAFAEANTAAGIEFADKIVRAKDFREVAEIQMQFARQSMEAFTRQVQEMSQLFATTAQSAQKQNNG